MINTNIAKDTYIQLTIPNNDIMAIHFNGEFGHLSLFNIYNNCTHNDSLSSLSTYLSSSHYIAQPTPNDHMIWLGDLNCHHPLWEPETNWHLDSSDVAIQPLLNFLDEYDMNLALPPGIPTYETATHNWTCLDNIWHSHHDSDPIISCITDPHICPPKADHLPIITVIELPIARTSSPPSHDFHSIDFDEFNTTLKAHLDRESPATLINSKEEFDEKVDSLTSIIQQTIYDLALMKKPWPFSKRWWTKELTELKKVKNRISYEAHKLRDIIGHPTIEEHKCVSREFTKAIDDTASAHWIDWLETISPQQIYTANKYVINESSDASCACIPTLKTSTNGEPSTASTNIDKAKALATSFFPSAPSSTSILQDHGYPIPVLRLRYFSHHQIREIAKLLKPHKAPGPDSISNVILIKCIDTLVDHLFFIYRAAVEHNFYHDCWLLSTTLSV